MLDFQASVAAKQKRVYRLNWQGILKAAPPAVAQPVQVADAGDSIRVATGALRVSFNKTRPLLWREVSLDGQYLDFAERRLKAINLPYMISQAFDGLGVTLWPGIASTSLPWIFPALHTRHE